MLRPLWAPILPRGRRGAPRGGWQMQNDADALDLDLPETTCSHLGKSILLEWCDGDGGASKVYRHAMGAVRDGVSHPMIIRLSNTCRNGQEQHCHGGLVDLHTQRVFDVCILIILPHSRPILVPT